MRATRAKIENKKTGITTTMILVDNNVKHVKVESKKLKENSPYLKPYKK